MVFFQEGKHFSFLLGLRKEVLITFLSLLASKEAPNKKVKHYTP